MNDNMLARILLDQRLISAKQLEYALAKQKDSAEKEKFSATLVKLGYLKEQALQRAIAQHEYFHKFMDVLVTYNFLTKEEVDLAYEMSINERISLFKVLFNLDFLNFESFAKAISIHSGFAFSHLSDTIPDIKTGLANSIMGFVSDERKLVPIKLDGRKITVAMSRPLSTQELLRLEEHIQLKVEAVIAPEDEILKNQRLFSVVSDHEISPARGKTRKPVILDSVQEIVASETALPEIEKESHFVAESDSLLAKLVNKIIYDAWKRGASDIHIEPAEGKKDITVRMRVDGCCENYEKIPFRYKYAIPSRLKIMADLDISEKRKPQDGKIVFRKFGPADIELRLATMPTVGGLEDVVLRLLTASKPVEFKDLALTERNLREFNSAIRQPYGLVLVVGPTGSGKTTTLHSAIASINTPKLKIWTAEDPVEITQPGLRQVQVHPRIGLTFAAALRSFLRLDPDVIMVGEMRDEETAAIAVEASLTGHLVFSTLHTNSAPETLTRLLEMGIDPYGFADSLLCILAQRLARRLCGVCRQEYTPDEQEWRELVEEFGAEEFAATGLKREAAVMAKAAGCADCHGTGYKGRLGIHELLTVSEGIKASIKSRASTDVIRTQAVAGGMTTLRQDGILKVIQGLTDIHEIRRVCTK